MSFLFNAIKGYVYPTATEDTNTDVPETTATPNINVEAPPAETLKKNTMPPPTHPYRPNPKNQDRIIVQRPAVSIPTTSLNKPQLPTFTTQNSDSDSDLDSIQLNLNGTSITTNGKLATPYLPPPANAPTPAMTLSTAEDPDDETTPSFPAVDGPQRLAACSTDPKSKRRIKFALAPGHSPLDWARLTGSGTDLRGVPMMGRYTLAEVKEHRSNDDAWTVLNGKVYNITAYLPFHPGGEKEVLRCAGRDGTRLFNLTHKWVNYEYMLKECQVGFLVSDGHSSNKLTI